MENTYLVCSRFSKVFCQGEQELILGRPEKFQNLSQNGQLWFFGVELRVACQVRFYLLVTNRTRAPWSAGNEKIRVLCCYGCAADCILWSDL